jgi:transcriptional regulator with XRE-family HTH domain
VKHSEYKKTLSENPEYQKVSDELKLLFAFGNAILSARLEHGWSQIELARRSGTKQANISRIEAGLANPTLDLVYRLCKVLEIDVNFYPKSRCERTFKLVYEYLQMSKLSPIYFQQSENASIQVNNWPQPRQMTDWKIESNLINDKEACI